MNPPHTPLFQGKQIWCPKCKDHVQFVRIQTAAQLAGVHRRTIYRYIEDSKIFAFRVAGAGSYRVCGSCLLCGKPGKEIDPLPVSETAT